MIRFAPTIFLGAFLLFLVQPLIARAVLPWFGGSASVWTVCMLFFQAGLLGGYAYAHALRRHAAPRRQALIHLFLLGLALAFLPMAPPAMLRPDGGASDPTLGLLLLLAVTVGAPYFVLAATGPLMQHWYSVAQPGTSPYRLYALSNLGSMLGLLVYPFAIEPLWSLPTQSGIWSSLFVLFAAMSCAAAVPSLRSQTVVGRPAPPVSPAPALSERGLWVALPACGSLLLLATTNQLCQDVASVPFLWVLPLSLYLLTFIIAFDADRWYRRWFWWPALVAAEIAAGAVLTGGARMHLWTQVIVYSSALFVLCMVCHGELARRRPAPDRLTGYYLAIALGGAVGGLLVGVVAPMALGDYWEYPIGLVAAAWLTTMCGAADIARRPLWQQWSARAGRVVAVAAFAAILWIDARDDHRHAIDSARNFYGVLRVNEVDAHDPLQHMRSLTHGRIRHGEQFQHEDRRRWATSYYGPQSGVGLALDRHPVRLAAEAGDPQGRPLRVGAIGLGTGTLATYARPGDRFEFFEINAQVERFARRYFTYLADCRGSVRVSLGDARVVLESRRRRERPGRFDVLAVDAFSSDAIPVHLLTREAFELYRWHMAEDGILAVHVSNRHLDLEPIVWAHAQAMGWSALRISSSADDESGLDHADWVLLTPSQFFMTDEVVREHDDGWDGVAPAPSAWTDDYSNLFSSLK